MFLALLIIAAVFIVIAIIQKNWIYAVVALGCVVIALLLGHHGPISKAMPQGRHMYVVRHAFKPIRPGAVVAFLYAKK